MADGHWVRVYRSMLVDRHGERSWLWKLGDEYVVLALFMLLRANWGEPREHVAGGARHSVHRGEFVMTVREVSGHCGVSRGKAGKMLQALVGAGFIEKVDDAVWEDDERGRGRGHCFRTRPTVWKILKYHDLQGGDNSGLDTVRDTNRGQPSSSGQKLRKDPPTPRPVQRPSKPTSGRRRGGKASPGEGMVRWYIEATGSRAMFATADGSKAQGIIGRGMGDWLRRAIERYAEDCKAENRDPQMVPRPGAFFAPEGQWREWVWSDDEDQEIAELLPVARGEVEGCSDDESRGLARRRLAQLGIDERAKPIERTG